MTSTSDNKTKKIFGLDLLRVGSIMLVLCSHSSWIYPPSSSLFSKMIDMCGFFGVELFFVLSGYLVGSILYKLFLKEDFNIQTIKLFLTRRFVRIAPNYYLIILINCLIGIIVGYSINDFWRYFLFFQNFSSPLLPFFPESWSLPIKEFSYLFLILFLWVAYQIVPKLNREKIFIFTVISLLILSFLAKIFYQIYTLNTTMLQWDISLRSVVIYRMDTVLCGVLFGYLSIKFPEYWKNYRVTLAFIGLLILIGLIIGMLFFNLKISNAPWFWNVLCLPINGLGLCFFIPLFSEWKTNNSFLVKPINFISEISYSIYLIHYSIVLFLLKTFFPTKGLNILQLHFYTLAYISLTIIFSTILYYTFEKRILDLRK